MTATTAMAQDASIDTGSRADIVKTVVPVHSA